MKKTDTAQDIARTLYDVLTSTVYEQLDAAAEKLAGVTEKDAALQKRIESALPADVLPQVRNFLLMLAQEGQLSNLSGVVQEFEQLIQRGTEVAHAEVVSAVELDDAQRERILSELQKQGVQSEYLRFKVDETLIGGLIIRVGDKVVDNSLRARLGVVQRSMLMS